jgi:hypothetical protein
MQGEQDEIARLNNIAGHVNACLQVELSGEARKAITRGCSSKTGYDNGAMDADS